MAILLTFSLKHIAWQQDIRKGFKFPMYTLTDRRIGQSYQCKDSLMKKENRCRLRLRFTLSFRLLARQYIFQSYDSVTRLYSPSLYLLRWVFLCLFLPLLVEAVASKILWCIVRVLEMHQYTHSSTWEMCHEVSVPQTKDSMPPGLFPALNKDDSEAWSRLERPTLNWPEPACLTQCQFHNFWWDLATWALSCIFLLKASSLAPEVPQCGQQRSLARWPGTLCSVLWDWGCFAQLRRSQHLWQT